MPQIGTSPQLPGAVQLAPRGAPASNPAPVPTPLHAFPPRTGTSPPLPGADALASRAARATHACRAWPLLLLLLRLPLRLSPGPAAIPLQPRADAREPRGAPASHSAPEPLPLHAFPPRTGTSPPLPGADALESRAARATHPCRAGTLLLMLLRLQLRLPPGPVAIPLQPRADARESRSAPASRSAPEPLQLHASPPRTGT
mmetsp:Transcript_88077/g.284443  ORF Transcript_88077/g.284443 Transcript_88077/m.284443 type:complete len:201 (+) Transcript_88077:1095-1697(+)